VLHAFQSGPVSFDSVQDDRNALAAAFRAVSRQWSSKIKGKPTTKFISGIQNAIAALDEIAAELELEGRAISTTNTPDQHALALSGIMADRALELIGGRGLHGMVAPAHPDKFSDRAKQLRAAAEEYNDYIIELHMRVADTS
jgi:hypothetical protein